MRDAQADRFARQFLKQDAREEEYRREEAKKRRFPFFTIVMVGAAGFIHYYWNNWNFERAKRNFVFSEMNMIQGNPHSAILNPISFEIPYYFLMNIPGLLISGFLIEKYLGSRYLLGLYLAN